MGSPKSDNICQKNKDNLTTSSCPAESTAAKESSIFGDMSNLSPVQPLKYAAILQGFPRIASPPYVLTSPNLNPQSSFLNRQQRCLTSSSGYSQDNVDLVKTDTILEDPENTNSKLCVAVECSDQKGSNATSLAQLQPVKTLIAGEDLLVARVDEESIDSGSREHKDASKTLESIMEKSDSMKDNNLASQPSTVLFKQADECSSGGIITGVNQMRDESHQLVSTSAVCSDHVAYQYINHANGRREGIDSLNEVSHAQSGILRRCLQFDDRQQKSFMESSGETTERQNSIPDLSQNFSPDTPYDRHMVDQFEFASAVSSPSCSSVTISKPRGIGLHLNSIVAGRPGDLVTRKQTSKGMVKLAGKTLILPGGVDALALSADNVERISSISESDVHVTEYAEIATPNKSLSLPDCAKPLDLPIQLSPAGEELAESTGEESNQEGSNTGRKQASRSANPDGCKRCSCKKSKCLKLYCDCFAAGLYCADSCSCQGCFNRPDYRDTVTEARQQIESRNPLAFAPRILQHVTNSPTNSGGSGESVPQPSLRHKRGCNCRKSMCLKKYCECYEANVGCSDGCRCEGCKNLYGKKPDYTVSRHITNKRSFDEISDETPNQSRKLLITSRNHLSYDSPVALPVTPALLYSDSRKKELKSLLPGRRYVLSPEPNHTPPSAVSQSSSGSSLVQHSSRKPAGATRHLNPGGLVNLCQFTQLTNPLQKRTPIAPSSNASNSQVKEASISEMVKSETPDSSFCLVDDTLENDTPIILRDSPVPINSVKVSSPNKKRISPPYNHSNELRPSISGGLRSSRKFIFRSVPRFPSLSPTLDPNNPSEPPPADTDPSILRYL